MSTNKRILRSTFRFFLPLILVTAVLAELYHEKNENSVLVRGLKSSA
jgi:hypothetical protein